MGQSGRWRGPQSPGRAHARGCLWSPCCVRDTPGPGGCLCGDMRGRKGQGEGSGLCPAATQGVSGGWSPVAASCRGQLRAAECAGRDGFAAAAAQAHGGGQGEEPREVGSWVTGLVVKKDDESEFLTVGKVAMRP